MGVVNLADYKPKPVKPKSETHEHAGQKYTCRFDPNAPDGQKWVWIVDYVRVYREVGSGPTMEAAASKARRHIHSMNKRIMAQEERDG
jgi:hypothetical protein